MNPQDQSAWGRLPGPGEPPSAGRGPESRDRGIRYVRRLSNWTAAALVAATAVTAGYFARTTGHAPPAPTVAGAQSGVASSRQPCVTVPVATSGGSGVSTQLPVRTCGPAGTGSRPVVIYVKSGERGD